MTGAVKNTTKLLIAFAGMIALIPGARAQQPATLGARIVVAARQQVGVTREYDPSYTTLSYPGGDVPLRTGVCSDVVVRALRQVGVDLQREVHEDMQKNFDDYPKKWGLKGPDKNIDHRRVANLMRYFERRQIAMSENLQAPETYRPGDIVAWDLGRGVLHIGIVSDKAGKKAPRVIHNIGAGAAEEDVLFEYHVIGHYRVKEAAPAKSVL
jgi:uncharacterized protein YijF (DUF1287 family)